MTPNTKLIFQHLLNLVHVATLNNLIIVTPKLSIVQISYLLLISLSYISSFQIKSLFFSYSFTLLGSMNYQIYLFHVPLHNSKSTV